MKTDDKMILNVIETAAKNLKESDMLLPTFFIGNKSSLNIVGAPFDGGDEGKDKVALVVKQMARSMDAEFVIFVSESWTLPQDAAQDFMMLVSIDNPCERCGYFIFDLINNSADQICMKCKHRKVLIPLEEVAPGLTAEILRARVEEERGEYEE